MALKSVVVDETKSFSCGDATLYKACSILWSVLWPVSMSRIVECCWLVGCCCAQLLMLLAC